MIITAIHGQGTSPAVVRRVYYSETETLREGYALCYDISAIDVTPQGQTLSQADSLTDTPARRLTVVKPTWKNNLHFAGVVSNKSDRVTGPGWIEINCPGSICNIFTAANCDVEAKNAIAASRTGIQSGQMLTFSTEQWYFKYQGLPGSGAALILGDVDRSSTNGLVMAELMTGPPSGGFQILTSDHKVTGKASAISLGGSVAITPHGYSGFSVKLSAACTVCLYGLFQGTRAVISVNQTVGKWQGQCKVFRNVGSAGVAGPLKIVLSEAIRGHTSLGTITSFVASGVLAMTSIISDYATCEWKGNNWMVTALSNSLILNPS